MDLPVNWRRSRVAALAATLFLHLGVAAWLLSVRYQAPHDDEPIEPAWFPLWVRPEAPPPAPVESEAPPPVAPITAPPVPMPDPAPESAPAAVPDWSAAARDVAQGIGGGPSRRSFGRPLAAPADQPALEAEPFWKKPLPRVGTTVTTPEGETIIWVSDYCYVSISSRSFALADIHEARRGVRTCILAQFGGEKKARGDLFDPIKRPPPAPQEPGCRPGGAVPSCGR